MRIGLYLGRHRTSSEGMAIYSRSFLRLACDELGRDDHGGDEIVVYGGREMLSSDLVDELLEHDVLGAVTESVFRRSASSWFVTLPNGARTRILMRVLPSFSSRYLSTLFDQFLLPLLILRDKLTILHSTSNVASALSPRPQVITLHDLFQLDPPVSDSRSHRSPWKAFARLFYSLVFRLQFSGRSLVVTDCNEVADAVERRFRIGRERIRVIALGVDEVFEDYLLGLDNLNERAEGIRRWAYTRGVKPNYILLFASDDPRKNFATSLEAAVSVLEQKEELTLCIRAGVMKKKAIEKMLSASIRERTVFIDWLSRSEMPVVLDGARVVCLPTIAEGFGLPALESISVGTPVVTAKLDSLASFGESPIIFRCDPTSEESVRSAILSAIASNRGVDDFYATSLKQALQLKDAERVKRMREAVKETFAVYKEAFLRYAGR